MKYIIDPITGEKHTVKKIIHREHYSITVIYDNDDINFDELHKVMAKLLFDQAIRKMHKNS